MTQSQDYVRLSCRLSAQIKQNAEEAAALLGQSMTNFTELALAEKAQAVLERYEHIRFSQRDFARFAELIENPKPPTQTLRDAMAEYQSQKTTHPKVDL